MKQGFYFEIGEALTLAADKMFRFDKGVMRVGVEDLKMVIEGAENFVVVEGVANGKMRTANAIEDAVLKAKKFAEGFDLFSAEKVLMQITYAPEHQMLLAEMADVSQFADSFPSDTNFVWGVAEDEKIEGDRLIVRLIVANLKKI